MVIDLSLYMVYIQERATPENLCKGVLRFFDHPEIVTELKNRFTEVHNALKQGANERAADAAIELLKST